VQPDHASQRRYRIVEETLRRNISEGRLPRGLVLLEGNIAEIFQTSRDPVRRALQRLEADDLIHRFDGRGYLVGKSADRSAPVRKDIRELGLIVPREADEALQSRAFWERIYDVVENDVAGCLVFGALPRLKDQPRTRDAVLLGLGVGLQILSRPFESLLLDFSVALFFVPPMLSRKEWPKLARIAAPAVVALIPAVVLLLFHNHAATGSWTTLPYALSRFQYGVPTTFTFQANPIAHAQLTAAQQLYYDGQAAVHGPIDTFGTYLERLVSRAGFYRFFFLTPLLLVLPFFLWRLRDFRVAWVALTLLVFAIGTNFYPYFFPHYIAAATCLFVLVSVAGLSRLNEMTIRGRPAGILAARWILALCGAHFLFWYGIEAQGDPQIVLAMGAYETGDGINYGDPQGRIAINLRLREAPGRHLVFVRYFSSHRYDEWIHNAADIDSSRIVWALELSPEENAKLERYYPGRTVWLLEPDALPPKLDPSESSSLFFADDYVVGSRAGLPSQTFFLFTTQFIDLTKYPRNDFIWPSPTYNLSVAASTDYLERYTWRHWAGN